jgi:hypothetical protein
MMIDLYADTKRQMLGFGDFLFEPNSLGWSWCHVDWLANGVEGSCKTLFEALEASHAASERMLSEKLGALSGGTE